MIIFLLLTFNRKRIDNRAIKVTVTVSCVRDHKEIRDSY